MNTLIERIESYGRLREDFGHTLESGALLHDIEEGINAIVAQRDSWEHSYKQIAKLRDALVFQSDHLALELTQTRTTCNQAVQAANDGRLMLVRALEIIAVKDTPDATLFASETLRDIGFWRDEGDDR